jgi:hypothetical protein
LHSARQQGSRPAGEYDIVTPQRISHIATHLPHILEDGGNGLPGVFRQLIDRLGAHLKDLDRQVHELEVLIQAWHRANDASRKLADVLGIGPITWARTWPPWRWPTRTPGLSGRSWRMIASTKQITFL